IRGPTMAKNRSPGRTVRESMLYPSISRSAPPSGGLRPRTSRPPTALAIAARLRRAMSRGPPAAGASPCPPGPSPGERPMARRSPRRPQDVPRDLAIVERDGPLAQDLVRLVPLAGDHDAISLLGEGQGAPDRLLAIRDHQAALLPALPAGIAGERAACPRQDLLDDSHRVLAPRVVRGHDHDVAPGRRGEPHQRALAPVPVAAAAEHRHDAPRPEIAHRQEEGLQGVVRVGVIDQGGERLSLVDALEAPRDAGYRSQTPGDGV